ncbi:BT4734/BF3469 family protein [Rufibacter hautae]|uniref:AAA family ATPase n=1 Tax=Rufibacter hautae TaxID=2595005 RepID=A0A5B6TCH9_9BACT|nr:BT4734/BF3469 family protein [Rufibacter hautae]KAA3436724.1 AAA family ATPase [Rufibacter hautae]
MTINDGKENTNKPYNNRQISIYRNFNHGLCELNKDPFYKKTHSLTIKHIHEVVKLGGDLHGVDDYKKKISHIRVTNKAKHEFIKKGLPSFTVSADFEENRKIGHPMAYTQIMCFDFDNLTTAQTVAFLKKLKKWEYTLLAFRSPSGTGVKLFICVDSYENQHTIVYKCLELYLVGLFGLATDPSCVDYSRLCFFSYDRDAYYNPLASCINTKQLMVRYQGSLGNSGNESGMDLEIIDYSAVNTGSVSSVFHSLVNQLRENGLDWIDGQRNSFLLEICKLKKWGITLHEAVAETMSFINRRYTSDYNEATIPEKLRYHWQNYYSCYDIPEPPKAAKLQVQQYLTEHIETIKAELQEKRIIFIDAPTGAGKTTLIKRLAKEMQLKTDILMPTTALVEQQTDITGITGKKALTAAQVEADVLACCYNSIAKVQERGSRLLVIDEAHSLVSDYGFKNKTVQDIQRNLARYDYIIYLSGSMLTLNGYYSPENLLSFEKKSRFNYEYQIVELSQGSTDKEYFISNIDTMKLNVFYQNDKSVLDNLYQYLTKEGYNVAYISRDKKEEAEYRGIVENSSLKGYDVLLTTCVIQAGVNITDCDKEPVITFGRSADLIDYIQFTARFRSDKPLIKIIHSNRVSKLKLSDISGLKDRIEIEKQMLEKANERNKVRHYGSTYLEADSIVKGYDMVFEDYEGNYITDNFRLLYANYLTLCHNVKSNVRLLKRYLSQYHFTEIGHESVEVDRGKSKQLKKVSRNNSAEIKVRTQKVIDSILSGTHIFNESTDKVTVEIERKYRLLSNYLTSRDIKNKTSLLTSNSLFELNKSRITYILAEKEITAERKVDDNVQVQYERLKNLESLLTDNTTYSGKKLRAMIKSCGLDTIGKSYINNTLGVLYYFDRSRNGQSYTVKGRIKETELISKKVEFQSMVVSLF